MSPTGSSAKAPAQPRVRLGQESLTTLVEWQLAVLRQGLPRPALSDLLEAAVVVASRHSDELISLVRGTVDGEDAA